MVGGRRGRRARSAGEAQEGAFSSFSRCQSERNLSSTAHPMSQGEPSMVARKMIGSPCPGPSGMRTITLKKIKPQNQQVKESAFIPRRSPRVSLKENKENSPPGDTGDQSLHGVEGKRKPESSPPCCSLTLDTETSPKGTDVPSPGSANAQDSPPEGEQDLAMAKRVRRSYSRLEISLTRSFLEKQECPSTSAPTPGKRQTLFGFEKVLGELAELYPLNTSSTTKMPAAETNPSKEPDTDIPGISFGREKRRKRKMPQFEKLELDEWAAQMNAEFEEAERFDLLVE